MIARTYALAVALLVAHTTVTSAQTTQAPQHNTPKHNSFLELYTAPDSTIKLRWGNETFSRTLDGISFSLIDSPPIIEWETEYALCIRRSCGSPCWYSIVLPLHPPYTPQTYMFPLAFDTERLLVVTAGDGDTLFTITNMSTGARQSIMSPNPCSGRAIVSCINSVTIGPTEVSVVFQPSYDINILTTTYSWKIDRNIF